MELSKRAHQDFDIWKQILNKESRYVIAPSMTEKQKYFWYELMRLYNKKIGVPIKSFRHTDETLLDYSIKQSEPIIMYSGGLESSVIRSFFPTLPYVDYLKAGILTWTNPIEPSLMIFGSGLGYGTIFYGSELLEGGNRKIRDFRDFNTYLSMLWKDYSGSQFLSPITALSKHDLFKIALRDNIPFYSCFSNSPKKEWCGKCYKCLLIDTMYHIEGHQSPITMRVSESDILSGKMGPINKGEISVYRNLRKLWNQKK